MKNIFLTLFVLLFIFSCNQTKHYDSLEERIEGLLDSEKGEFAVAYKNLNTGETILINENEKFIAHNFDGEYLDCGTLDGYINSSIRISKL